MEINKLKQFTTNSLSLFCSPKIINSSLFSAEKFVSRKNQSKFDALEIRDDEHLYTQIIRNIRLVARSSSHSVTICCKRVHWDRKHNLLIDASLSKNVFFLAQIVCSTLYRMNIDIVFAGCELLSMLLLDERPFE